jgi:hypothetical protein
MDVSLPTLFNLYQLPIGRLIFGGRELLKRKAHSWSELQARVTRLIKEGEDALRLQMEWTRPKPAPAGRPETHVLDDQIDNQLSGLYAAINGLAHALAGSPLGESATRLRDEVFGGGVQRLTQLTHVEQVEAVEDLLKQLRGAYGKDVHTLQLEPAVARIEETNRAFRDLLTKEKPEGISYDRVRAANARAQQGMLESVAMIVGRYPSDSEADIGARRDLLAPILAQNEAVAASRRSRRPVRDVNPDTGQELPPTPAGGD